jgi:hypothetical protein
MASSAIAVGRTSQAIVMAYWLVNWTVIWFCQNVKSLNTSPRPGRLRVPTTCATWPDARRAAGCSATRPAHTKLVGSEEAAPGNRPGVGGVLADAAEPVRRRRPRRDPGSPGVRRARRGLTGGRGRNAPSPRAPAGPPATAGRRKASQQEERKQDEGTVVLTRDEAAFIRRAPADCHDVIARAGASGDAVLAALRAAALDALAGRSCGLRRVRRYPSAEWPCPPACCRPARHSAYWHGRPVYL